MTQFLPPNLLALFAPRDPIPFLPPLEKLPHEKHHNQPYSGIAPYIREFEDPRDAPPPTRAETREERMERKRREKIERRQQEVESELKMWDPHNDPNAQGDAFKTLFVARVNYDTTESKLRREFEVYGPIKRIYMVYNKRSGKPRGYAFIEYEHERDMHCEYPPPQPPFPPLQPHVQPLKIPQPGPPRGPAGKYNQGQQLQAAEATGGRGCRGLSRERPRLQAAELLVAEATGGEGHRRPWLQAAELQAAEATGGQAVGRPGYRRLHRRRMGLQAARVTGGPGYCWISCRQL